jgi:hypothetical protein
MRGRSAAMTISPSPFTETISAKPEIARNGTRTTCIFTGVPGGRIDAMRRASSMASAVPVASISSSSAVKVGPLPTNELAVVVVRREVLPSNRGGGVRRRFQAPERGRRLGGAGEEAEYVAGRPRVDGEDDFVRRLRGDVEWRARNRVGGERGAGCGDGREGEGDGERKANAGVNQGWPPGRGTCRRGRGGRRRRPPGQASRRASFPSRRRRCARRAPGHRRRPAARRRRRRSQIP